MVPQGVCLDVSVTRLFFASVQLEKEKQREQEKADKQKRQVGGCLDPLTETLTLFEDDDDLTNRIADLYVSCCTHTHTHTHTHMIKARLLVASPALTNMEAQ